MTQASKKKVNRANTAAEPKTSLPPVGEKHYLQLSDVVINHLVNKQRADTFVKEFKNAISSKDVKGAPLKGHKFTLPKVFRERGNSGTYTKETRDYAIENNEDFQEWFSETNKRLAASREGSVKVTMESLNAGLVDFDALFEQEQTRLAAAKKKGALLGKSRVSKAEPEEEEEAPVKKSTKKAPTKKTPPAAPKKAAKKAPEPEPEEEDDDLDDDLESDDTDSDDDDGFED